MSHFKRVGLVGRPEHSKDTLARLRTFLQGRGLAVVQGWDGGSHNDGTAACDLLIVVGGDGSMLNVAQAAVERQLPVIGVNRGRLGFLTDILPDELEAALDEVLSGNYTEDHRFLFDVYPAPPPASPAPLGSALNDVVLHAGAAAQMIEFELRVGPAQVYNLMADGLIIATPTGSTAYALSAGGPIMHPDLDAMALVPMNPHSLSSRPIVVAGDSEIRLAVAEKSRGNARISCDGRAVQPPESEEPRGYLIKKKPQPLKLIHPPGYNYYGSCRSKLGWGTGMTRHGGGE